ncbi:MAG: hypothetical protein PWQ88_708 [Candidatus Methanomethylophilaceae archaeon]|nr:hypothetical protein [Candidatus Methanomethylophilaceae archaeon]MDI3542202.1 hypothetical protein [Candidatus Methanomethylophilaceae archaeon]
MIAMSLPIMLIATIMTAGVVSASPTEDIGGTLSNSIEKLSILFEPNIESFRILFQEVMDFITENPNIYAFFEYNEMLTFIRDNILAYYLGIAVATVYLFAVLTVLFRSRKNDPERG